MSTCLQNITHVVPVPGIDHWNQEGLPPVIRWCRENVHGAWVHYTDAVEKGFLRELRLVFAFEREMDALLFKLCWG